MDGSRFSNTRRFRSVVQAIFFLFSLFVGLRFYLFYLWTQGQGEFVSRPAAVEAFLPISALVGLKRLLIGGGFDPVHPAGLSLLLIALLLAFLLRKGFCGWICPVGFVSNFLARPFGNRWRRPLPVWCSWPLAGLKYLLLGFFVFMVFLRLDTRALADFQASPFNIAADARMLLFFLHPSALAGTILLVLFVLSLAARNPWCRFLCPYGALLGIFALFGPLAIHRQESTCISCKRCNRICPAGIRVAEKKTIRTPECVGCGDCLAVCPVPDCLNFRACGRRRINPLLVAVLVLTLFFLAYAVARLGGWWETGVTPETFRRMYRLVATLPYP